MLKEAVDVFDLFINLRFRHINFHLARFNF